MTDKQAEEAVTLLRELADREDVSSCEAGGFDMPESEQFHDRRRTMLSATADEIERLRAALKPFAHAWNVRNGTDDPGEVRWLSVGAKLSDCKRAAEVLK